jgi:hypothetical protein
MLLISKREWSIMDALFVGKIQKVYGGLTETISSAD